MTISTRCVIQSEPYTNVYIRNDDSRFFLFGLKSTALLLTLERWAYAGQNNDNESDDSVDLDQKDVEDCTPLHLAILNGTKGEI